MHTATRPGIQHTAHMMICFGIRNIYQVIIFLAIASLAGCGGGGGAGGASDNTTNLTGSVGDGPITGATITVKDANGAVVGTTQSDASASYEISVPGGTSFPVTITATGGTDIVTGMSPDFSMVTVALKKADLNSKNRTANINPHSTLIVYMAQAMSGGLSAQNIASAQQTIFDKFSFGLDASLIADPISSDINDANIAGIVKASEALGEMVRRTRNAMITSGNNIDGNTVMTALANDLADGNFDGAGPNADTAISATSKIVSAQVLIETIRNQLKVNNLVATSQLDNAILTAKPTATMRTADIALTDNVLSQTQSALAAAERFSPGAEISSLITVVSGLSNSISSAEVNTTLPTGSEALLDTTINAVPLASAQELSTINNDTPAAIAAVAPVITSSAPLTARESDNYNYDVNATDANTGDTLSYELVTAPAGMTIDVDSGMITWIPAASQAGAQDVVVRVTDNSPEALSSSQGFSIAVTTSNGVPGNTAPVITTNAILSAVAGTAYSYNVNATDANAGDTLSYELVNAPAGMNINTGNGMISWSPVASQVGTQDVMVRVTDSGTPALSASQGFSIAVAAANVAPVITSSAVTTAEAGTAYSYNVNATDANGSDSLNYSLAAAPAGMSISASTGLINWTPSTSQVGTENISVLVTDNGTPAMSTSQQFTITVMPESRPVIRVNAGGNLYVDAQGQVWAADYGYNLGGTGARTDAISGTVDDALYQSERYHSGWQDSTTSELEYRFTIANGDYAVKLYFAEIDQYVTRIFDVEVEGQLVLDNLDIVGEAGRYNALIKNVTTTVSDGEINIRFPRITKGPKVSAIEILPVNTQTSASTSNTDPVNILVPEAGTGTGSLSIMGAPANGTAVVNGNTITYTPNAGSEGEDTIIYSFIGSNGSVTISTITVTTTCDSCSKEPLIALGWQPNPESISGYRIYYGPTAGTASELISDIAINSGLIDPSAPVVEYAATTDLNFYAGEQICFKIQAYKDNQDSALSDAVCGTI